MAEHETENDYTPLDRIRAAERLIRDRAKAVTMGSPWAVGSRGQRVLSTPPDYIAQVLADVFPSGGSESQRRNSEHIATWHPAAALAVADMLHQAAIDLWAHGPLCECGTGCDACDDNLWESHVRAALALAEVVLPPGAACACGSPETYSLKPSEVIVHAPDGCTVERAAKPPAQAGSDQ